MSQHPGDLPPNAVVRRLALTIYAAHLGHTEAEIQEVIDSPNFVYAGKAMSDAVGAMESTARAVLAALRAEGCDVVDPAEVRAVAALLAAGEALDAGNGHGAGTATERIAALRRLYADGYRRANDDFRVSEEAMGAFCAALADPALRSLAARLAGTGGEGE